MIQRLWQCVLDELGKRAARPARRHYRAGGTPMLSAPDLASVRVLSERGDGDRRAVALTVDDQTGARYLVIRELVRDFSEDGAWRLGSGCEGPDRVIPSKPDPYVSFYAYSDKGHFFAGGRVQSASADVSRVRMRWEDGYAIEDEIENGVALLFGARDALERAFVEFFDSAGRVVGAHDTFIDER
jgi:hypothetical protein